MFEGFEQFVITTQNDPEVKIVGVKHSDASCPKPPLLLLHGFPQTRYIWHKVAPQLTDKFDLIIPDLRGYGESSKPEELAAYAKSAMARDFAILMEKLGYHSYYVCAHDRGARVAHKLLVDYPERVKKAIFLDICPTLVMFETTNFEFASAYFHWFMLIQKEPLPETLILGNPRKVAELFMGGRQPNALEIFHKDAFETYVKSLEDPAAVHAMCNDYRASATLDLEEARDDLKNGKLIRTPLKVLWGKHGVIEKSFDAIKEWRAVAEKDVSIDGRSVQSGHYIPEEAPDELLSTILDFFS